MPARELPLQEQSLLRNRGYGRAAQTEVALFHHPFRDANSAELNRDFRYVRAASLLGGARQEISGNAAASHPPCASLNCAHDVAQERGLPRTWHSARRAHDLLERSWDASTKGPPSSSARPAALADRSNTSRWAGSGPAAVRPGGRRSGKAPTTLGGRFADSSRGAFLPCQVARNGEQRSGFQALA